MATVIPKKGQIVLTKEAFDAKAAAGELIPGAEYLINNIQYVTTTEADMILQSAKDYTDIEANKKVDKTSVSESVVTNSVVKRTVDGDILVNDDNTAMASKPSNIAVSKGYVQYIMTTLSELFGQNLEAVISSISSSSSADGYTQTLTFKNLNDIGIGTLDIVMPKTSLEITEDSTLFKYTFTLKDSKGNTLSTKTIDLPLEELVVNGSYNNATKSIVLTLKNGNTVDIPVGDLVEGLVNSTDLQNALSNYATLGQVNAKYTKPSTGIPKADLDSSVQSSLGKADTALQEHQDISGKADKTEIPTKVSQLENDENYLTTETDPTVPVWAKQENKPTYTAEEVGALPSSTQYVSSVNGQSGAITGIATQTEVDKKVDKTSVSESVVTNSVVKRTVDGDILVNDDNTAMASKPSNIAVSKGYVQYIMTTLSELFGQNLEAVISSISSSSSADGYTQTLTFKNLNDIGIGTLDIVMPKTNLEITEDSSLFKYTFTLKDSKGNTLSTKTIDLPLEELVVNGSYNNVTKSIVLTLKNGNTVDIPVGDLVEGLVNATDLQNALSNYATLGQVNAKYTKPSTGIPKTDLDSSVQSSLGKADTALQEHQDISGKVDKINGKGLSTNDYTDTDKAKLNGLANIKTIGDNLTLDAQGKLSANVASGVSSINGQTGAVTGIATTEEVNTAKQSANSYTDTKTGEISTALQQNTTVYVKFDTVTAIDGATVSGTPKFLRYGKFYKFTSNLIIKGKWTLGGGYSGWSTPIAIATISGGNEALTTDELTYLNARFGVIGSGILSKKAYIENGTIYISVLQAAGGTNTITQVHFMQRDWTIIDYPDPMKYPIGSIYMSCKDTSPAEIYGGTWERIKDRFLLGAGDSYSAGATGGSATHTHSASGFAKICTSANGFNMSQKDQTVDWVINYRMATPSNASQQTGTTSWGVDTDTTVNSSSNMPPYLAVYIWKRTA